MLIEILEERIAPAAYVVTTIADSGTGSLRAAIESADSSGNSSNSIVFANGLHGTIMLKSPLPAINTSIAIGGSTNAKIAIDGRHEFQIFNVQGSFNNVSFTDLVLAFGNSQNIGTADKSPGGGAIYINDYSGKVNITNCIIGKNIAVGTVDVTGSNGDGGAIFIAAGTVDIYSSAILGNVAAGGHDTGPGAQGYSGLGGGIYVQGGTVSVANSLVTGNLAIGGNGLPGATGATGMPMNPGYSGGNGGNGGGAQGGGIWSYGALTVSKSTVSGNVAIGGRGANGGAGGRGAAGFTGGSGGNAGGAGRGFGGGIYSTGALIVNSSTVSGNVAIGNLGGKGGPGGKPGPGNGLKAGANGFNGGHSYGYGGGVHSNYSSILLEDSTVAGNVADKGGGLFVYEPTNAQLDNSTIAFNRARSSYMPYGGGLWAYAENGDPFVVISTVIADNVTGKKGAGQDLFVNLSNGPITAENSFIGSYTPNSVDDPNTNDIFGGNPDLAGLHNNGGPTLTCSPDSIHSPLIGMGANPLNLNYDQRGRGREVGLSTDIGAIEVA